MIHQNGINMRYMGRLRYHLETPKARLAFLTEMVARTCKNLLRRFVASLFLTYLVHGELSATKVNFQNFVT